ncbi:hypothetical protein HMPREF1624_00236 [Sporothrix schenckii ATCC 58251]|uniref:HECT-type E3 ubiquitin transferase n=1 Tax=Sporothrix schenckii (strain ATCC 58251 / de Perez 2211183) TaxID=1391915 RepID=U7Q5F9_SPOS1|nr:hypothetical protein HMPREF1624_00236 [Sporothrix schenckii ATCC 58251]
MTTETQRPPARSGASVSGGNGSGSGSVLLAGLWEEAPFARLPWDAPAELRELVDEVENPRRVYAVHKASRRHNFQLLIQLYIVQLRDGCGTATCGNATCLSFRKRLAGKAPLRRYNTTSARTLAIHLATQDNPEAGLCPTLKLPQSPPDALNSVIFTPKHAPMHGLANTGSVKPNPSALRSRASNDEVSKGSNGVKSVLGAKRSPSEADKATGRKTGKTPSPPPIAYPAPRHANSDKNEEHDKDELYFTITEKPVSKDYRSFAANMFGTVAFKMLEWLTPASVETMTDAADVLQGGLQPSARKVSKPSSGKATPDQPLGQSPAPTPDVPSGEMESKDGSTATTGRVEPSDRGGSPAETQKDQPVASISQRAPSPPNGHASTNGNGNAVRNASARMRAPTSTRQQQRKLSVDPFAADADDIPPVLSPLLSGVQGDLNPIAPSTRSLKSTAPTIARPISQLSSAGFFDSVPLEKMPPLNLKGSFEASQKSARTQADILIHSGSDTSLPQSRSSSSRSRSSDRSSSNQSSAANDLDGAGADSAEDAALDILLPQTLTRLNADVVEFVCDVLQDDCTREVHMLEPPVVKQFHKQTRGSRSPPLRRKPKPQGRQQDVHLAEDWRLFVEQSLFYVLSDPRALISSFTKQGQLYDTHTLWYCMLRLTRVAPSLVLHSLWVAAKALLVPTKTLLAQRLPEARLAPHKQQSLLTDAEAGMLMAICLHALVAVAPVVKNESQLYDMSRIRSQGLSLAGSGLVVRQPAELCLQYDDAFSNDLALRLARVLFSAIAAQRTFNGSSGSDGALAGTIAGQGRRGSRPAEGTMDILAPLFSQLDFLNMDAAYILNFSFPDRTLHETRVPTLLLDWARAVMLSEWTGSPAVPGDGHFGGALALIAAIYEKRQALLVGDVQFRTEYFAERLDEMEMPVAWLSFTSTRKHRHLLDLPFIFSPTSLVSYFRAINFSRMNRSFEESSSLQSRMNAIISPGSLIINPHHKKVLQDLLKMASTKYLVLDISRSSILSDAFDQLWRREQRELLRPLKVRLGENSGEEGIDSGGVQYEFFRLALTEALDPNYGAFTVDSRTHMTWFNPTTLEADWKFELIGLLVSLALFNGISLPVTFPKALYRKLLGEPVDELHHIADGWPDLASGLTALLEWNEQDGAVEDVFVRTYEFSVDLFGQPISRVMGDDCAPWPKIRENVLHDIEARATTPIGMSDTTTAAATHVAAARSEPAEDPSAPNASPLAAGNPGDDAPMVTGENRNAYVTDYIRYLTDVSVRAQYEAFSRGFRKCLHPKSLTLLTPALLQSLLEGEQTIDMDELRQHTRYVGWDTGHATVSDFWSIVSAYDEPMKRKLLEFVTASDRMPVGGAKTMQFVLQRNGEEEAVGGHLPTAYTCYGTLLLPEYPNREVLQERLAMALENAKGFGFS